MRVVALSLAVLCLLGCKEEEPGFELNERRMSELAAATCSCSDSVSNETCATSYEASLLANLLPQVQAGRVQANTALWNDCIAELRACEVPDVCEDLFTGTIPENGECIGTEECAPGLRCVADDPTDEMCGTAGTCEEIETFERGERCDREGRCEGNNVCGIATSGDHEGELVCRRPIEKGDPCPVEELGQEGTLLCEAGTTCVPDGDEVICGDPVAAGDACSYGAGLDSVGFAKCANGNFCNPATGVCEPFDFPPGADIGEDCEMRTDCLPGLVCVDDECSRPLPNGSECNGEDQCAAECVDDHCAPLYVACGTQ